ncbi:uncharacterized protein PV09_00384 [Verruconis gallopava]|uniref:Wax synthase domain-containing protein n=1 Tax=Verruconis gallopava TaxID=253628 RepID=A0A0D2AS63_9PEZI|nr:uncharacterized protein PV09_00384 [Verruconis gallopava]KIW09508.1 hypothetical protein PV09_00384 [Verruconis gallopava]
MFESHTLPTHAQRIAQLDEKYQRDIDNGIFKPYTYPFCAVGILAVVIYFTIPHRNRPLLRAFRFVLWGANLTFSLYVIVRFRARRAPIDYAVGLISWWFVLWTAAVMVVYDGQLEFARIERAVGATRTLHSSRKSAAEMVERCSEKPKKENLRESNAILPLVWQSYPMGSFLERVDWVVDLLSNFRGMTWNWRIPSIPGPPTEVQNLLKENKSHEVKQISLPRLASSPISREERLRDAARTFGLGYLCLDFIRTLTIHDPYFRGLGTQYKPEYMPLVVQNSTVLIQSYRLLVALFAIYWALSTIFSLAPIVFCGVLGAGTIGVRGEPWVYPGEWGSFRAVLDHGLAAWWSVFWHQTFRFAFEAPSRRLIEILEIDRSSFIGKTLRLFVAFALSGSIHASGSYTSIGDTKPLRGPFLFFILQPFGILAQILAAECLGKAGIAGRVPLAARRVTNVVFAYTWFYFTAPIFIEDLAKGGTFLYEPVPFSIFRLLGLGGRNESYICWTSPWTWFTWQAGNRWWETGLST